MFCFSKTTLLRRGRSFAPLFSALVAGCYAFHVEKSRLGRQPTYCLDTSSHEPVHVPSFSTVSTHAIYGSLLTAQNGILTYNVFRLIAARPWIENFREQWLEQQTTGREMEAELLRQMPIPLVESIVQLGTALDGHVGTIHGGILSLLIDDLLGYAFEALGIPYAVTANLSIDFRSPVPAGSKVKLRAVLTGWEGRKLYFNVHLTDPETDRLHCEAVSLFIIPREAHEKLLHKGFMKL